MNIVFTGPATDSSNRSVLRADLIAAVQAKGFRVQNAVTAATQLLVASRTDTVKAKRVGPGTKVTTYAAFIDLVLGGSVPKCDQPTSPNKYTDHPTPEKGFSDVFTEKDIL